uniref:Uncharacterized protein n=1 Tax=Panagrolaimus sp. ES5 TaxID=591445 RepID=A0AC34G2L3_9BILA
MQQASEPPPTCSRLDGTESHPIPAPSLDQTQDDPTVVQQASEPPSTPSFDHIQQNPTNLFEATTQETSSNLHQQKDEAKIEPIQIHSFGQTPSGAVDSRSQNEAENVQIHSFEAKQISSFMDQPPQHSVQQQRYQELPAPTN